MEMIPAVHAGREEYARAHGSAGGIVRRGARSAGSLIDEIVRQGARRMLAEALRAEVDA
jgi:hypothetical protein